MTEPFDRAAIKARAGQATPGPWAYLNSGGFQDSAIRAEHSRVPIAADAFQPDAEFIAHAREDIPALLAALEEAEGERDERPFPADAERIKRQRDGLRREIDNSWVPIVSALTLERNDALARAKSAERRIAAVEAQTLVRAAEIDWCRVGFDSLDKHTIRQQLMDMALAAKHRAALHPVAGTTEKGSNDE